MKRKRILSVTLALLLAFTIIPQTGMTALADSGDPALVSGGSALKNGANSNGAQILKYGGQDWYVIGYGDSSVRLLAKGNIGTTEYDANSNNSNAYGTSTLKKKVEEVKDGFDGRELAAVTPRNLDNISGAAVSDAHLWPLSTAEAKNVNSELRKADPEHTGWRASYWWLRSPGLDYGPAFVDGYGDVDDDGIDIIDEKFGVRPAFDLNLQSVIFTSGAGGKSSGTAGADALKQIGTNSGNEWKVTVKDEAHSEFTLIDSCTGYDSETGVATVAYKGAQTGKDEYISAVIINSSGSVTYYGRIAASSSAQGTVTINTKKKLQSDDTLYVFNEQYHEGAATDYASELKKISQSPPAAHTLTDTPSKAATCTEAGNSAYWTCSVCGKYFSDAQGKTEIEKDSWVIPAGHEMNFCKEVPATCTANGSKAHYACERCNKNFSDEQGTNELTTIVDPMTGHAYGSWEKLDDTQHRRVCSHDNTHVEKENHKWDDGKVRTKDGKSVTVYTCTVCKATKEDENKKETYQLSSGANGSWTKGSTASLTFTFKNAEDDSETFDHFTGIKVDGKNVPEKNASGKTNWTKKKGSVIIELKPSYLETLSVGKHKLTASFDDGDDVTTEFTVNAKAATPTKAATTSGKATTTSPNTGDESNMLLWFLLICASLFVMFRIISLRNRRFYDR